MMRMEPSIDRMVVMPTRLLFSGPPAYSAYMRVTEDEFCTPVSLGLMKAERAGPRIPLAWSNSKDESISEELFLAVLEMGKKSTCENINCKHFINGNHL